MHEILPSKQAALSAFFLYHCSRGDKLGDDIHVFRKGLKIRERKPFFGPFVFSLSFSRGLYNYYIQQRGGGGSIVHECVRIITAKD